MEMNTHVKQSAKKLNYTLTPSGETYKGFSAKVIFRKKSNKLPRRKGGYTRLHQLEDVSSG
jgi:hypothetical protein